jgi:hypothetical protein
MGLLDTLFGSRPERRGPTGEETRFAGALDTVASEIPDLTAASQRLGDSLVAGRRGERADVLGAGSADVAQALRGSSPVTNAGALERALNRARGLSRITAARSQEFDTNLLRERVGFVRGQAQRRGRGLSGLGRVAGFAEGLARNQADLSRQLEGQQQNILGTGIGIGAGFLHNANFGNPLTALRQRRAARIDPETAGQRLPQAGVAMS